MRSLVFLLLISAICSCDSKVEVLNPMGSLQVESLSFPELDQFSIRISHVNGYILFFVNEASQTLSKFSLLDQQLSQM